MAEHALRVIDKPMSIAEYQLVRAVPENLAAKPPTNEQIEADLQKEQSTVDPTGDGE